MTTLENDKKIDVEKLPEEDVVHDLDKKKKTIPRNIIIGLMVIIISGIFSGFFLSNYMGSKSSSTSTPAIGNNVTSGKTVGVKDTKTFPDTTEGVVEAGGLNGEGTHKLIRPGGESQTVYLTSSVLDLNQFVGSKVKVWGQTFSAQKAGWLMDVGRVEVL